MYGSNGQVGLHFRANTRSPCIVVGRKGPFGGEILVNSGDAIDTTILIDYRYSESHLRWLYLLLGWLRLDQVTKDSTIPGLNREDSYKLLVPTPPLTEPVTIARILDDAMNQIEQAINARTRNMELLKEYRIRSIADVVKGDVVMASGSAAAGLSDSIYTRMNETNQSESK